jgi:hypothetical protein
MKKLLLIFLFSSKVLAYSNYEANFETIPIELQYMVTSLNSFNEDHPKNDTKQIDKQIEKLNSLLTYLRKAEIYFIAKTEIYKAIYEISPGRNFVSTTLNFNFPFVEKKFLAKKDRYPFIYFLLYGLYNDYRSFKEENSPKSTLATPWLNFLNENDFEDVSDKINGLIEKIIERLITKISFYNFGNDSVDKSGDIIKIVNKEESKEKTAVKEIAESVIKKLSDAKTVGSKAGESDSGFSFSDLPLSELFPSADPNYNAPEKLPDPTNDWDN